MHSILKRQVEKYLKDKNLDKIDGDFKKFLESVDFTYQHFDEDRILIERSLDLSSKELLGANLLLKTTLESTIDGILVVNNEQRVILYNNNFAKMWKIPMEILKSRDDGKMLSFVLEQLISPNKFIKKVKELYSKQNETSFDMIDFKDGRVFERYSIGVKIGEKQNARIWSFRDITEKSNYDKKIVEEAQKQKRLNNILIDRELKMIELKNEIKKLKNEK